jgi:hypothetical protein
MTGPRVYPSGRTLVMLRGIPRSSVTCCACVALSRLATRYRHIRRRYRSEALSLLTSYDVWSLSYAPSRVNFIEGSHKATRNQHIQKQFHHVLLKPSDDKKNGLLPLNRSIILNRLFDKPTIGNNIVSSPETIIGANRKGVGGQTITVQEQGGCLSTAVGGLSWRAPSTTTRPLWWGLPSTTPSLRGRHGGLSRAASPCEREPISRPSSQPPPPDLGSSVCTTLPLAFRARPGCTISMTLSCSSNKMHEALRSTCSATPALSGRAWS